LRVSRSADGGAEFHDGLVIVARVMRIDKGLGEVVDFATDGGFGDGVVGVPALNAAENALDVPVDNRDRLVVSDAGDGGRGIGAYTGKFAEAFGVGGHHSLVV